MLHCSMHTHTFCKWYFFIVFMICLLNFLTFLICLLYLLYRFFLISPIYRSFSNLGNFATHFQYKILNILIFRWRSGSGAFLAGSWIAGGSWSWFGTRLRLWSALRGASWIASTTLRSASIWQPWYSSCC